VYTCRFNFCMFHFCKTLPVLQCCWHSSILGTQNTFVFPSFFHKKYEYPR
jgi:hypothetical protein